MKIRTNFVTNSSSSSFILGFKSEKDIQATLEQELSYCQSYGRDNEEDFNPLETVLSDCMESDKMTLEEMLSYMRNELDWDIRQEIAKHHSSMRGKSWSERYDFTKTEECQVLAEKEMNHILDTYKKEALIKGDEIFVKIDYSDNDGPFYSELEHHIVPELDCCIKRFSHH